MNKTTGILKSGEASFEPRARLLKLLGGELIRDDAMAVVELVKNAHDADASVVSLTFIATRDGSGEIIIEDDGDGMSLESFLTGWMQPANSLKRKKEFHYTKSGRRVLGEKGVGRFAIDRLGGQVQLISRSKENRTEIVASFDWDEFDDAERPLSEITSAWSERRPEQFKNGPGTRLRISGLRSRWTERSFRRLHSKLKRLISPFRNGHEFEIRLTSDEFPDYSGTMETSFLDRAPHSIKAKFDGEGMIHYEQRNGCSFSRRWEGPGDLECGPVALTLYGFDLEQESITRVGSRIDVRAWLREWSGVSIYRDGYRVLPYGEPDDDWLRLDQRRVNNPVVRLSNNQVCGFIEITGDENPDLRDQTNRGGLIQNSALEGLRALTLNVFRVLEAERQDIRNPEVKEGGGKDELGELDLFDTRLFQQLTRIDGSMDRNLRAVLERRFKAINEGVRIAEIRARERYDAYLELAGIGQTASFMRSTLERRMQDLKNQIEMMRKNLPGEDALISGDTRDLTGRITDELEACIKIISRNSSHRKNSKTRTEVIREIRDFRESVSPLLSDHGVLMSIDDRTRGLMRVHMRPEVLVQALHVLLWNSLEALEGFDGKVIRIRIELKGGDVGRLVFQDNGCGIEEDISDRIFEPRFTLKDKSRGMGLAIAMGLLRREEADIILLRDRRRAGWTSFAITLKVKKSRVVTHGR